ncbi:MarR family winged helix-turn-helix transcriptional regulator [uncultured Pseudosulfitobacter sp.]|uniref:MarR family winged helix-turn-helix transcriptional regulator n=1 Tax=uncultured Pseudosulfitobacter sp. TaxID=2854214 RepID=UPI0030DCD454|tara:strand:+ start:1453 stop:1899 length:447 start_codon:yes stop_codon:yes gene_type:complete
MNETDKLYRLIWMSRPLMQAAEAAVEQGLDGTGLTVRTRAVLEILLAHDAATVPDIAQHLEIKRQYVQVMVNETLAENLTCKRDNPRHKRSTIIALTDKGRALIEDVVQREKALVASLAAELDAGEINTALKIVETLIDKLKTQAGDG